MFKILKALGAIKELASILEIIKNFVLDLVARYQERRERKLKEKEEARVRRVEAEINKPKEEQDDEVLRDIHRGSN